MDVPPISGALPGFDTADWVGVVREHPAWALVAKARTARLMREQVMGLVGQLATVREKGLAALAGDPWQDGYLAVRMANHLGALLAQPRAEVRLRATEAALLVTVPFLHETVWSLAVHHGRILGPEDLTVSQDATTERAAFERFAQSYSLPYRRAVVAAARGDLAAAGEIGWWLLHRWVARQPAAYRPPELAELLAAITDGNRTDGSRSDGNGTGRNGTAVFPAARTGELLRALRADPGFLGRPDRSGALASVAADGVRERMVGYLASIAYALSIEAVDLTEVIGDHLGIGDPVSPADLHATVAQATWRHRGTALVLGAACTHPAVEVALRSHVEQLNHLLVEVQRANDESLAPLQRLPTHVTTDGLQPSQVGGARAYQSAGVRFRLAEDRVRELLMGEQLYGDPALAIRELYQNALDACRYRQARTQFLDRTAAPGGAWVGRITFEQGVDSAKRSYLDCVDNGIGMGLRELSEVFSQAGVRTSDLPEFLEEQAEWARVDPPVQLYVNSRFGIGVLSYFMLADEITVDTCRLGRDARPGPQLRVSIAGPGSLFRIQNLGPGTQAGTRIRLHLREGVSVSCVETLRTLLWVADFHTEATHGTARQVWQPGELSSVARPHQSDGEPAPPVVAVPRLGVWWCRAGGAVLADGLWAGQDLYGAVVNLARDLAPRLSVDRTKMLGYREEDVERLLWQAIPELTAAGPAVLTYDWLYRLATARPLLADVIFERALDGGYRRWKLRHDDVDAAVLGCFTPDGGTVNGPDPLVEWRITALAAAGAYAKVVTAGPDWHRVGRARPSDALLLSVDLDATSPWLDPFSSVATAHVARAALRIGRSPGEIAGRLDELGYSTEVGCDTVGSDPHDAMVTSQNLNGSRPWLDPATPVVLPHLMKAAQEAGRSVPEVVARLVRLGFTVDLDLATVPIDSLEPFDLVLTSRDLDASVPWLDPVVAPPLVHVIRAAHLAGRDISDVAARLGALGYPLPAGCAALHTEADDLLLISRDLDSRSPWLDPATPVSALHVLNAAQKTGRGAGEVAARFVALGFTLSVAPEVIAGVELSPDDLVVASCDLDGVAPWLHPGRPVSVIHLVRAADRTEMGTAEIVTRLARLGYRSAIDPDHILLDRLTAEDETLISVDLDGEEPLLDPARPVPALHVVRAARQIGRDIHALAARLAVLGYTVDGAVGQVPANQVEPNDLMIISQDLGGSAPWLPADQEISVPHVLLAASRTRRPARDVAARLEQLGYRVSAHLALISTDKIKSSDLLVASADLDRTHPWLDAEQLVPLAHVLGAALELRCQLHEVVTRLTALGYHAPDLDIRLPRALPGTV